MGDPDFLPRGSTNVPVCGLDPILRKERRMGHRRFLGLLKLRAEPLRFESEGKKAVEERPITPQSLP
jgi:hypothetical protein